MSAYNYDANPWDDNQDPNAVQQQTNYGGYTEGYSNPAAEYSGPTGYGQTEQQYQYQDDPSQQQQQQPSQEQQQQQQQEDAEKNRSVLGRFIRQRIPICGPILDTISSINLPFIDALVQHINRDLLVSKMFYFFFYSAFGSLFPLMGVYFKQQGMNPAQVGILTGVRPFIEIFSAPFWNSLAERFQKSKALLLFSLLSWIVFTYSLAHIRPPASACVAFNDTDYVLYTPYSANDLSNYEVESTDQSEIGGSNNNEMFMNRVPPSSRAGGGGSNNEEKEGKGQILASEENQNDQRRRKRRSTDADDDTFGYYPNSRPIISQSDYATRYSYSVGDGSTSGSTGHTGLLLNTDAHLDLDLDLENDFDDKLIRDEQTSDQQQQEKYHLLRRGNRFERGVNVKDIDDVLGESDENDENDSEEQNSNDQDEQKSKVESSATSSKESGGGGGGGEENGDDQEEENENEEGSKQQQQRYRESGQRATNNNNNAKPSQVVKAAPVNPSASTTTTQASQIGILEPDKMVANGGAHTATLTGGAGGAGVNKTKRIYKQRHKTPPTHIVGMSPITVEYAVNYNKEKHSQFVTPMFSTIVYKLDDIKEVFFLLLLLISLGEFFSAPALTLADSATLSYLGDNIDLYGRQRMFGSFSWAITLLLVGMALDNATSIADHPCGPHQRERSYTVCFVIFSLLMACAFLTATQFKFNYQKGGSGGNGKTAANGGQAAAAAMTMATSTDQAGGVTTTTLADGSSSGGNIDQLYATTQPRSIFNTAPPVNAPPPNAQQDGKEKFEFLDKWRSAVFAQRTWELPEWVNVFRQFNNPLHLTYLFITWFLGCGVGLVFTFLFWHLQDVGGTPTLFGICSVINHISEILAYFFSFSFIKRFGHTRVLSVGLGCNVIRFLYVAFLNDPYYALPFELVQGITHAACFAACCSYMSHVSKPELRTSTQGVMQGLHHGIGRACGALLGGYMINAIGSRASFCIYGLLSGCVLTGFLYIRKKVSEKGIADEEVKVDDSEALGGYGAPQGVPSAIPGKLGGQTVPAASATTQDIDYHW